METPGLLHLLLQSLLVAVALLDIFVALIVANAGSIVFHILILIGMDSCSLLVLIGQFA